MALHFVSVTSWKKAGNVFALDSLPFATPFGGIDFQGIQVLPISVERKDEIRQFIKHWELAPARVVTFDSSSDAEIDVAADDILARCVYAKSHFRKGELKRFRVVPLPAIVEDLGACESADFEYDVSFLVSLGHAADVAAFDSLRAAAKPRKAALGVKTPSRELAMIEGLRSTYTEVGADGVSRVKAFPGISTEQLLGGTPDIASLAAVDRPFLADVRAVNAESSPEQLEGYGAAWGADSPPEQRPEDAKTRALVRNIYGRKVILNTGAVPVRDLRASLAASRAGIAVARLGSAPARLWEIASAGRCAVLVGDVGKLPGEDCGANYDWVIARVSRDEADTVGQVAAQTLKKLSDAEITDLGKKARETFDKYVVPSSWLKWLPSAVEKSS